MWLPNAILADIEAHCRVYYIDVRVTQEWNAHRAEGELRLLTGWCWVAKTGAYRQGFKSKTVAYRDAYYALIARTAAPIPGTKQPRLRVVRRAG